MEFLHGAEEEVEIGLEEGVEVFLPNFGEGDGFVTSGVAEAVMEELAGFPIEHLEFALYPSFVAP